MPDKTPPTITDLQYLDLTAEIKKERDKPTATQKLATAPVAVPVKDFAEIKTNAEGETPFWRRALVSPAAQTLGIFDAITEDPKNLVRAGLSAIPPALSMLGGTLGGPGPAAGLGMGGVFLEGSLRRNLLGDPGNEIENALINLPFETLPYFGHLAKGRILRNFGNPASEQLVRSLENPLERVPLTEGIENAYRIGINPTTGQATGSRTALNLEELLPNMVAKRNAEDAALMGEGRKILESYGLEGLPATGEFAEKVSQRAIKVSEEKLKDFSTRKRGIFEIYDRLTPPVILQSGEKEVSSKAFGQYGSKTKKVPVYTTIESPVKLVETKNFADSMLKEIEALEKKPSLAEELKGFNTDIDELKTRLTAVSKFHDVASLKDLDRVRELSWKLSFGISDTKVAGSLRSLSDRARLDIKNSMDKTVLSDAWEKYTTESSDYLGSLYSKTGRPLVPPAGKGGQYTPEQGTSLAFNDFKSFKNMDTVLGGTAQKPAAETKQMLLREAWENAKDTNVGINGTKLLEFFSDANIRDKFKYAFNSDERAAIQKFVQTAIVQNRRGGANQILQFESSTGSGVLSMIAQAASGQAGHPFMRGLGRVVWNLGGKDFTKILADPKAARYAAGLMETIPSSPAAKGRTLAFLKRAAQLGINLTANTGERVRYDPKTDKVTIEPSIMADEKDYVDVLDLTKEVRGRN